MNPFGSIYAAMHALAMAVNRLATAVSEQRMSCSPTVTLKDIQEMEKRIMAGQAEIEAALGKIDAATNKLAANVQVIADTDQKISDEIDAFLAANPVGTVLTEAQIQKLQDLAELSQSASDASDTQVAVLKAIAAKGAGNPVPVPVPEPPVLP